MKPVKQQHLHDPAKKVVGDCMRACVASVLELPIDEVPHFGAIEGVHWIKAYLRFLHKHGWGLYTQFGPQGASDRHPDLSEDEHEYYFAIGQSPRHPDRSHMVVCRNKAVVHDPHPDKTGLEVIEAFEILFKFNPDAGNEK